MSLFTSHGAVYPHRAIDTGRWAWALSSPLTWEVRGLATKITIVVPAGFITDLGSVPWWARFVVNPADPQLATAFILHDWLLHDLGPECQTFAASQLYEALRALGVPRWRRKLIAVAVMAAIDNW